MIYSCSSTFSASIPFSAVITWYNGESCRATKANISLLSSTIKTEATSFLSLSEDIIRVSLSSSSYTGFSRCSSSKTSEAVWCCIGMERMKRLHSISWSIVNVPWCNSANERAKASPMPVPGTMSFPSRYCTKGRNMFSRITIGIIFPSLLITIVNSFPASSTDKLR